MSTSQWNKGFLAGPKNLYSIGVLVHYVAKNVENVVFYLVFRCYHHDFSENPYTKIVFWHENDADLRKTIFFPLLM